MKNIKLLAIAAVLGLALSAQAARINGSISISGGWGLNSLDINTATALTGGSGMVTHFPMANIIGVTGDFATPGNILVNSEGSIFVLPFSFNPVTLPVTPLWHTIVMPGQVAAGFDLTGISSVQQPGNNTLTIMGTGILSLQGFDPTPGSWIFTAQQAGGPGSSFSFSASNATLPDGGVTAMLIGGALAGLAFIRRKLA
jgi:hypothetical protein